MNPGDGPSSIDCGRISSRRPTRHLWKNDRTLKKCWFIVFLAVFLEVLLYSFCFKVMTSGFWMCLQLFCVFLLIERFYHVVFFGVNIQNHRCHCVIVLFAVASFQSCLASNDSAMQRSSACCFLLGFVHSQRQNVSQLASIFQKNHP